MSLQQYDWLLGGQQGAVNRPTDVFSQLSPESHEGDLLSLQWPTPPRNIFIVKKDGAPIVTESLIEFVKYEEKAGTSTPSWKTVCPDSSL